jgi:hypothetical protein
MLFILCVLRFLFVCVLFLLMYVVVYSLFVCRFTDHFYIAKTQLQLINIRSIINYAIKHFYVRT